MPSPRTALLLLLLAPACGGKGQETAAASPSTCPIAAPVAAPTFAGHILPALQLSCGSKAASCHGTATPAGHVSYDTDATRTADAVRADLVGVVPSNAPAGMLRVAPYDVPHSWLVAKITQDSPGGASGTYGARMPYGGPDVCTATVQAIEDWIDRGAP